MANRTALFSRVQPGGVWTIENLPEHPGDTFFVDSGAAGKSDGVGAGRSPDIPFATLDYAVGQCADNNGDVIYVMPGHVETVIAAGGLDLDKIGITVIGLGSGSDRPTVNFTTATAADADVDAANITLRNLLFTCGIDEQVIMLDVNADDCTVEDCEFRGSAAAQPLDIIDINGGAANGADRATVRRCKFVSYTAAATANEAIELGEVNDEVLIEDCVIDGDWGNAGIHNPAAKILTNLRILRNVVRNRQTGDHAIELVSACTGELVGNSLFGDTLGTILDPGSLFCAGNLESAAVDVPGIPTPIAAQDGASNFLGADNADNAAATTLVAANEDGSVLERLEQLQEAINKGTGTALAANESLVDVLYAANGIVTFPAAAAPANGISIAEVIRYIADRQIGDGTNTAVNTVFGKKVSDVAADLLDSVQNALFTISGGRVLLTALYAEISVAAVDAGANATKFISNPTVGTDMDLCATLDITADELGTLYGISGIITDAMTGGSGGGAMTMQRPIILAEGTIDIKSAVDGGVGGALFGAVMWYIPIDDGATVAAA